MNARRTGRCLLASAAMAAALGALVPAHATTLFSDNFDTDAASSTLNFGAFNNWTVSNGTVDYIRSGGFGIGCVGGTGGCVDMDGSTGDAGRLTSKTVFNFAPGVVYTFSIMLSGNQRGGAPDAISMGVEGGPGLTSSNILASMPFSPVTLTFGVGSALAGRVYVEGAGNDNIGPILDNVLLADDRAAQLPEPGALGLLGLTLSVVVLSLRARR